MKKLRKYLPLGLLALLMALLAACTPPTPNPTIVPIGQIAVVANPNYDSRNPKTDITSTYAEYRYAGESLVDWDEKAKAEGSTFHYTLIAAANVPSGYIGIYTKQYVDGVAVYDILAPGLYRDIPAEFVDTSQAAAVIPGDKLGLYCNFDETKQEFRILPPGTYALPASMVKTYTPGSLRYRTLDKNVLANNPLATDPACQSNTPCETTITNGILKGSAVRAAYDVDVEYSLSLTQANARTLCAYNSLDQIVQSNIATTLRGMGRAITENFTEEELLTEAGRSALETSLLDMFRNRAAGEPINFIRVSVRSITIGDEAYQKAKQEAAQQVADEQNRGKILEIQLINAAKQNEILALIAQGWARVFEIVGCKGDAQCMAVILSSPYFNPNAIIPVTPTPTP